MALSIKQKARLGTMFFFILLIFSGGMGIFYFAELKTENRLVLADNYKSLIYCQEMNRILNKNDFGKPDSLAFEKQLRFQLNNITEPGEKEASQSLEKHFLEMIQGNPSEELKGKIRADLNAISELNLKSIETKNKMAGQTAETATRYLSITMAVVFLIGFTFLLNFPSFITDPINRFKEGVAEIKLKNYHHRIHLETGDEFQELGDSFNSMAEQLEVFESSNLKKLMVEKARVDAVINSFQEASIGIDLEDNLMFINQQAAEILGLQSTSVTGMSSEVLGKKNDLFRFLLQEESSRPFKIVLEGKECFFVKDTTRIFKDSEALGTLITLQNITRFQEKDEEKTKFIATISHELKTPISSILMGLKLLENEKTGNLNPEQKQLLTSIEDDSLRLLKITAELLNLSQVETGKIQLAIQTCKPEDILAYAIQAVQTQANQKGIRINTALSENLPNIKADPEKMAWVFINLLTNAIRYSESDKTIEASISKEGGQVVFSFRDQGKGIAKEFQEKIFERFFQVPGSSGQGYGLGLSISKEFIEAQGGTIRVQSEPGRGSQFDVSFATIA